ncbi:hypothetical protein BIV25_32720 [Streptomyces sp. MUSC 14]|nr:hypothetical protein BIV25_32720 [Streptomyces sp. MUSC 14]
MKGWSAPFTPRIWALLEKGTSTAIRRCAIVRAVRRQSSSRHTEGAERGRNGTAARGTSAVRLHTGVITGG